MKVEIDLPDDAVAVSLTLVRGWFPTEVSTLAFNPRKVHKVSAFVFDTDEKTHYVQEKRSGE